MPPRPATSPDPDTPPHSPGPEDPLFLSTGALQDPTLRTPGSEIPEAVYAASDAESFRLGARRPPSTPLRPREDPRFALLLGLLLLAIITATAVYLYRDRHPADHNPSSKPHSTNIVRVLRPEHLT